MIVELNEQDLKNSVLSLVVALVEIIKETLKLQALKRMEAGTLTEVEMERLGEALLDLDSAINKIKVEIGIAESVNSIRDGLDKVVDDAMDTLLNPGRWERSQ